MQLKSVICTKLNTTRGTETMFIHNIICNTYTRRLYVFNIPMILWFPGNWFVLNEGEFVDKLWLLNVV